jgi:hypothetical protein
MKHCMDTPVDKQHRPNVSIRPAHDKINIALVDKVVDWKDRWAGADFRGDGVNSDGVEFN